MCCVGEVCSGLKLSAPGGAQTAAFCMNHSYLSESCLEGVAAGVWDDEEACFEGQAVKGLE